MAAGLLDTLLGAPLDNSRSHLDCVIDVCASPSLLALSRCGWCLHLALAPSLQKAEQTSEADVCAHFGMVDLTQLIALRTLTWNSGLLAAQCRHLGTWLRVGGKLEGVVELCVRRPDEEEDEDEHESDIDLLLFQSDETRTIRLRDRGIDDELMITLAHAMGSMGALRELNLYGNQIGDAGMQAFADTIGSGSMGALTLLALDHNHIGDAGLQALAGAIGNGSLPNLRSLDLGDNTLVDEGMKAFALAIASGSLPKCAMIVVSGNPGNTAPLKSACEERGITCF
jgi:hypothetical protein